MKNANPVSLGAQAMLGLLLAFVASGCGGGRSADAASESKSVFDHFPIDVGGHTANLQVAVLEAEQQRGLMQRPDLGGNDGMIFIDTKPHQMNFWMKDTPEPLDIAYIGADGAVAEVYELLPLDERTVTSHSDQLQFALEMPKGWFAANGIHMGSKVDLTAVVAALKARGFDPANFGFR
jgi:uncharacterized protein